MYGSQKRNGKKNASEFRSRIKELKCPLFVKPVHLGSSIGITKARDEKELENAIEVALHYDDKVLVEEGIEPLLEITLPIMGNDDIKTAECERPLNKTEMFDFNDKYLSGGKSASGVNNAYSEVPANIGDELTTKDKRTRRPSVSNAWLHRHRSRRLSRERFDEGDIRERSEYVAGKLVCSQLEKSGRFQSRLVLELIRLGRRAICRAKEPDLCIQIRHSEESRRPESPVIRMTK